MDGVPAKVAGVGELVLCLPPAPDGAVPDVCLAAAHLVGVDEVWRIGGAQAVAAMAYGTESMRAVDVIAGPGNVYVALAKQQVAGDVGIAAAFAGPSEIVVIADDSTPPTSAAIDLVVQAEHGPGGLAWLVAWQQEVIDAVVAEVDAITASSPRRADIEATFAEGGYAVLVDDAESAVEVSNAIAPEHLQLMTADAGRLVSEVRHAGAVFCGPWAPASLGDYIAGPSHTLPTNGSARFAGALGVEDFQKRMHVIDVDRAAFEGVRDHVATLARIEGLVAHSESVSRRAEWAEAGTTVGPIP
jgi:histidinol dehydrogenase